MSINVPPPLESKTYRYKKPTMEFFCPLCRTKRYFTSSPRLCRRNYLQMALITLVLSLILYPLMGPRSFFVFFVVWACFEAFVRLNFRKEIPCPHCGFDASWYKRDVVKAREIVQNFWGEKKTPAETEIGAPQEGPLAPEDQPMVG